MKAKTIGPIKMKSGHIFASFFLVICVYCKRQPWDDVTKCKEIPHMSFLDGRYWFCSGKTRLKKTTWRMYLFTPTYQI